MKLAVEDNVLKFGGGKVGQRRSNPITDSNFFRAPGVHLTKTNYSGGRLLRTIRNPHQTQSTPSPLSPHTATMATESQEDVMRPPESSDEELADPKPSMSSNQSTRNISPAGKRKREPAKPTRTSQRKKLKDDPDLDLEPPPKPTVIAPKRSQQTEFDILSQPSQKRRPGYGVRSKIKFDEDIPMRTSQPTKYPAIDTKDIDLLQSSSAGNGKELDLKDDPGSYKVSEKSRSLIALPTLDDDVEAQMDSSASTSKTLLDDILPDNLKKSDANLEIFSSPLTPPEVAKDEYTSAMMCPVCRKSIDKYQSPNVVTGPRRLSLKDQKAFCRQHSLLDAQKFWDDHDYPTIDWEQLETARIPAHIPHLRKVLGRKISSLYFKEVEFNVNKAKGHRRKINDYLIDAFDLAKAGYYGPKVTGIVMRVIENTMSKDIADASTDKLVKAIGQGQFVACVLVPEAILKLVMEDLKTTDEAEARRVIGESTEAGTLLNPDDDRIDLSDLE
jgi:hypothetical protein